MIVELEIIRSNKAGEKLSVLTGICMYSTPRGELDLRKYTCECQ